MAGSPLRQPCVMPNTQSPFRKTCTVLCNRFFDEKMHENEMLSGHGHIGRVQTEAKVHLFCFTRLQVTIHVIIVCSKWDYCGFMQKIAWKSEGSIYIVTHQIA